MMIKKIATVAVWMAAAASGSQVWADDAPAAKPIKTHKQLMQQCMAEQKGKTPDASVDTMKKTCEAQLKSYQDHPSSPTPESAPHP